MKKKLQIIGFSITMYMIKTLSVFAAPMTDGASCSGMLGDPNTRNSVAWYLQQTLEVMRFVGIILCIVLTCMDIFKMIITDEKADAKPISTKMFKRLMYVVILFFLPSLVNVLMSFVGAYSTCGLN